ncbi:CCDC47 family protein [Sporobolomyces salmoneus]|uniref:CCDC47 family protein n=1 Tax=Sporobolomyces salmoneus TaxID=183962 RepID=UPI00316EC7BC
MRPRTSLLQISLIAGTGGYGLAASPPPPTTVDAANPIPGEMPHLDNSASPHPAAAAHESDFISSAKVVPPGSPLPYEGIEYRLGPLKVRPRELQMEGLCLGFLIFYFLSTFFLIKRNKSIARRWFKENEVILRKEFAGVGFGTEELWKADGGDEFVSYFSGRRGIEYGWAKVNLKGYDVITKTYYWAREALDPNYDSRTNRVVLDFKLAPPVGTPGAKMCFAVLKREQLKKLRESRWDLRTFTKLSETLPISPTLIAMTESGDITNALLYDQVTGLKDALQDGSEELEWFKSLVISDMPAEEPDSTNPTLPVDDSHLILTLRLPPGSKASSTRSLLTLACNIADVLYKKEKLVPEVAISKAKKRRSEALDVLLKPLREASSTLEATKKADAAALKRKMEQEKLDQKLSSMTPSDRLKYKQKEEEKERKKRMVKVSRKGGK